jgi:hypothetical protein
VERTRLALAYTTPKTYKKGEEKVTRKQKKNKQKGK